MARWWTKPPLIIAALGVLAVILIALLPRTTITQYTSELGSPAIGSAGHDVTIMQQPLQPPAGQSPATLPSQPSTPPATPTLPGHPWLRQLPVIAVLTTFVAALIQRARDVTCWSPRHGDRDKNDEARLAGSAQRVCTAGADG
jgi:hypothetical protein